VPAEAKKTLRVAVKVRLAREDPPWVRRTLIATAIVLVGFLIIIPLVKPGIIAGSILVFIPALGAYVTPSILGGGKNLMLGNLIELQFGQGRNWPLGSALSITLMMIVMIALLFYVRNAGGQENRHG